MGTNLKVLLNIQVQGILNPSNLVEAGYQMGTKFQNTHKIILLKSTWDNVFSGINFQII